MGQLVRQRRGFGIKKQFDSSIIGTGQAGLVMSFCRAKAELRPSLRERHRSGDRWQDERWNGLRFQYPNWSLRLPGKAYDGDDPDGFADKDEIHRFLTDFAAQIAARGGAGRRQRRIGVPDCR